MSLGFYGRCNRGQSATTAGIGSGSPATQQPEDAAEAAPVAARSIGDASAPARTTNHEAELNTPSRDTVNPGNKRVDIARPVAKFAAEVLAVARRSDNQESRTAGPNNQKTEKLGKL